jgi:hypothetical protein
MFLVFNERQHALPMVVHSPVPTLSPRGRPSCAALPARWCPSLSHLPLVFSFILVFFSFFHFKIDNGKLVLLVIMNVNSILIYSEYECVLNYVSIM